jgi:hypothetical protein
MAIHTKSKIAANLLRLGFIDFSLGFGFLVSTSVRPLLFGSRTDVFLLGKAETAVETRQVFFRAATDQDAIRSALLRPDPS